MGTVRIIIINGYPKSGKDTFIELFKQEYWKHNEHGIILNVSSVDEVKEAAMLLGWDGKKNRKGRQFLSDLKDLSTDAYDGPFKYMLKHCEPDPICDKIVFLHIREPAEINKLCQARLDSISIFMNRNVAEKDHENTGDSQVECYDYDEYIDNNGTLGDLQRKINKFIKEYEL